MTQPAICIDDFICSSLRVFWVIEVLFHVLWQQWHASGSLSSPCKHEAPLATTQLSQQQALLPAGQMILPLWASGWVGFLFLFLAFIMYKMKNKIVSSSSNLLKSHFFFKRSPLYLFSLEIVMWSSQRLQWNTRANNVIYGEGVSRVKYHNDLKAFFAMHQARKLQFGG